MSLRNLQIPSEVINKLGIPQLVDVTDQLPVNKNYTWEQLAGTREINSLSTVALHHDAYPKLKFAGKSDMEMMQEIARDHIKSTMNETTGDAGFPYDIYIRSGRAYQTNDILPRKYGVRSNNGYTVHVCVSGDYFNYDTLTDGDRNALYGVLLMLKSPDVLPSFKEIKGHKEFTDNKTNCPGYDVARVKADILHIENQLAYEQSALNKKTVALSIANQLVYLANLSLGKDEFGKPATPGNIEYGTNMIMELKQFMDERGLKY